MVEQIQNKQTQWIQRTALIWSEPNLPKDGMVLHREKTLPSFMLHMSNGDQDLKMIFTHHQF